MQADACLNKKVDSGSTFFIGNKTVIIGVFIIFFVILTPDLFPDALIDDREESIGLNISMN